MREWEWERDAGNNETKKVSMPKCILIVMFTYLYARAPVKRPMQWRGNYAGQELCLCRIGNICSQEWHKNYVNNPQSRACSSFSSCFLRRTSPKLAGYERHQRSDGATPQHQSMHILPFLIFFFLFIFFSFLLLFLVSFSLKYAEGNIRTRISRTTTRRIHENATWWFSIYSACA